MTSKRVHDGASTRRHDRVLVGPRRRWPGLRARRTPPPRTEPADSAAGLGTAETGRRVSVPGAVLGSATLVLVVFALAVKNSILVALVVFAVVFVPLEKAF